MTYILDTNILLHTVRNTPLFQYIDSQFDLYGLQHETIISAVSVGEIYALAKKNRWGHTKILMVKAIIRKCNIIPVEGESLMEIYADIDAFS